MTQANKLVKLNENGLDYFGFDGDENYIYLAQLTDRDGVYVLLSMDRQNEDLLAKEELFVEYVEEEDN